MKLQSKIMRISLAGIVLLNFTSALIAAEISGDAYGIFCNNLHNRVVAFKIRSPNGIVFESETTTISSEEGGLPDGQYSYEIIGYLDGNEIHTTGGKEQMNNGRETTEQPENAPLGVIESGYFRIAGGVVLSADGTKE